MREGAIFTSALLIFVQSVLCEKTFPLRALCREPLLNVTLLSNLFNSYCRGNQECKYHSHQQVRVRHAGTLKVPRFGRRFIHNSKIVAGALICSQQALHLFKRKGPRATAAKNRDLITAFIHGPIAIERFRDCQRFTLCFESRD